MNTARDGDRSAAEMPCTPFRAPYRKTLAVKKASSTIWPIAPLVGNPLAEPQRDDRAGRGHPDEHGSEQVQAGQRETAEELLVDGHRHDRDRAAQPHRRPGPVQQRGQGSGVPAERAANPDVSAALLRDRGPQLGADQRGRDEEGDEEHDQPGERLAAADGDRADGVGHHHGGDQEEDRVEPAEHPPELLPLGRGGFGRSP